MKLFNIPTWTKVACGLFIAGAGTWILAAHHHRVMTCSDHTAAVVMVLTGAGILLRETILHYSKASQP
jgi:hypothetical protein